MTQEPFNPYAPPESTSQRVGLPADTEFLVSDECILCGDEVNLPRVCIFTGSTDDLEQQHSTAKWTPRWLGIIQLPLFVLIFIFGPDILFFGLPISTDPVFIAAILTLIVANLVAWGLAFRMRRRATISWYVSRRHRQEEQRRRRFWKQAILLAVCVACVIIMTGLYVSEQWLGIIVPAVLVTAFCISRHNEKVEPVIVGQHEGLNILAGLSSSFLQKVNDMIEQHRAKHAAD